MTFFQTYKITFFTDMLEHANLIEIKEKIPAFDKYSDSDNKSEINI